MSCFFLFKLVARNYWPTISNSRYTNSPPPPPSNLQPALIWSLLNVCESRWSSLSVLWQKPEAHAETAQLRQRTVQLVAGQKKPNWVVTGLWPATAPITHSTPTIAPRPGAGCQEPLMNLFSRQPCYLGLRLGVRECTQWDLKPNHLLHSPTPLPDSQPSPFTKHQLLGTLSHCHLPFGMIGLCLRGVAGAAVCVFVYCMCACLRACASVHLSIWSRSFCI